MGKIMNKGLLFAVIVSNVLLMSGCIYAHNYDADGNEMNKEQVYVVNTIEETPEELIEEYIENSKIVVTTKYYEMSDGTWRTDEGTYKYKLEITGRLSDAAAKDSVFLILSNIDNITFEQAARASGLSSYSGNSDDIKERIERGILDLELLLEPVDISKYDGVKYIPLFSSLTTDILKKHF